jgi:hypothetical protein
MKLVQRVVLIASATGAILMTAPMLSANATGASRATDSQNWMSVPFQNESECEAARAEVLQIEGSLPCELNSNDSQWHYLWWPYY